MRLQRVSNEPILSPREDIAFEKDAVLNAAAIYADDKFHLYYRAVAHNPGDRNRSCIGYAWSHDGVHFERMDTPLLATGERPEESKGLEDARLTKIDDTYHLVYTAWNEKQTEISRATSTDLIHWERQGIMFGYEQMGNNKNAALFPEKINGEYALIHRPIGFGAFDDSGEKTPLDMWISFSPDLVHWHDHQVLMRTRRDEVPFEWWKIGTGGVPMKTDAGWLLVYHAVDYKRIYRLGLVLFDLNDPTKILKRTDEPILEPETEWELNGDVNNVVFTCGTVLRGTELWVYYGGADKYIGLAKGDVAEFLGVPAQQAALAGA